MATVAATSNGATGGTLKDGRLFRQQANIDRRCQARMGARLKYGVVGINTGFISNEVAPFGGMKQAG